MSTIFISHSSADSRIAEELANWLKRQGHVSLFLDVDPEKGIVAGRSWERTLYRKLRACKAVIAICTDNYLTSHWCFAEIALARMEGKHLFALLADPLSETSKLPSILTEKQFINLRSNREEGLTRLQRGLREMDILGFSNDWNPAESPYLGLSSYQEKHAPVFFGREEEAIAGVELLERGAPGLIMTLGASGSGKSSLVRAGIIPRLRRDQDRWLIVEPLRPGRDPFYSLVDSLISTFRRYAPELRDEIGTKALLYERLKHWKEYQLRNSTDASPAVTGSTMTSDERIRTLLAQLEDLKQQPPERAAGGFMNFLDWTLEDLRRISQGNQATGTSTNNTLVDMLVSLCKHCAGEPRILLVIDQFEELLGHENLEHTHNDFMRLIRESIELPNSPIRVLSTMRSDYLDAFQQNAVMHNIDFESLSLGPVGEERLRRIIEVPAKLAAIELEPGLSERLVADTKSTDALPLLSFTLWVLWRDYRDDGEIRIAEYEKLGGLQGAIAREADALLNDENETPLREAFLLMARINDEGQYARRAVDWDSDDLQPIQHILDKFVERRLLVIRGDADTRTIEVAHEALFRSWQPLNRWLDENRAQLRLKQEISREASSWVQSEKPADNLWRGARLQQASALLSEGKLEGDEKEFVKRAVRRRKLRLGLTAGSAAAIFLSLAGLTLSARQAEEQKSVALTKVVEALSEADKERQNTRAAQKEAFTDFINVLQQMSLRDALRIMVPDGEPGEVFGEAPLISLKPPTSSDNIQTNTADDLMVIATLGDGRVFAVAHNGVLQSDSNNHTLLKHVLRWMSGYSAISKPVLYSVGHCEVVSLNSDYNLPEKLIREETGLDLFAIRDLDDTEKLNNSSALIIGNAWGELTDAEIQAVVSYVNNGGNLIMAGLLWSWEAYKNGSNFNPCSFQPESLAEGLAIEQDVYPMQALGQRLGITWK
ncbi:MAG: toll/interleukin-1 receptor domain-containing protein [Granulosicoccus sp.]